MFESLPDSFATALAIMKLEPPGRPVVELDKQGEVVESRPYPEAPVFSLMKRKTGALRQAHFGSTMVVALKSVSHVREVYIDDAVAAEQATSLIEKSCKGAASHRAGEGGRHAVNTNSAA